MKNLSYEGLAEKGFLEIPLRPDYGAIADTGEWDVSLYDDPAALEASWRKLEAQGRCTVFQTYDWAACWYEVARAYGEAEPLIVTVSHKHYGVVWIMPLCILRKKNMTTITFADLGLSNYTGPVMSPWAPSDPEMILTMIRAVMKALPRCDLLHFQKLPEKIGSTDNPFLLLQGVKRFHVSCCGIELSAPWRDIRMKNMSAADRSNIRRRTKHLEKEGQVAFEHHRTAQAKTAHLGKLLALQNKRFTSTGRAAIPEFWQEFYKRLVRQTKKAPFETCISTLSVSGETIATSLGIVQENSYQGILISFAGEEWNRFSPGILLCDALLDDFPGLTGCEKGYFDFSTGDNAYKRKFGCQSHPLYEYMRPCSAAGLAYYWLWRVKDRLRSYPQFYEFLRRSKKVLSSRKNAAEKEQGIIGKDNPL